jgi:hypothetical protein
MDRLSLSVAAAIELVHAGDRQHAHRHLTSLWDSLDHTTAPADRCTLAHFIADLQDDIHAELAWDLRALAAATGTSNAEDRAAVTPQLDAFLPSLHLNAGDAYRRIGDLKLARHHARIGLSRAAALPNDGYGEMVRTGLRRLLMRASRPEPLSE